MFGKKRKEGKSRSFRRDTAAKLDGKYIKCITERFGDGREETAGHTGAFILKGGELIVYSEEKVIFRSTVDETDFSELLSLGGVIIRGSDTEHGGIMRTLVVYYTYHI